MSDLTSESLGFPQQPGEAPGVDTKPSDLKETVEKEQKAAAEAPKTPEPIEETPEPVKKVRKAKKPNNAEAAAKAKIKE